MTTKFNIKIFIKMKTMIETKFEVGQNVYFPSSMCGRVYEGKIHRISAEWSPFGFSLTYDVLIGNELSKGIDESRLFATEEEARMFLA